uniref:Uncharacterized protein n=1 Tax=Siphoviridae sp. ctqrl18 TaxID=2825681 RepID=A0A8S5NTA1_9CAUD|nr:MAG TPA: hypothetical protein [Siphoviridae sp. ctqrl18]
MITNGYVGGESTITKMHNETRANMSFLNSNTSFYGIPSLSVPARTYVDKIICIMDDSAGNIGTTATGVNVGVVSKSTGRILEYLKRNQTETIIANPLTSGSHTLNGNKAISISINKAWQEEVYFIVGAMKMMAGYENSFIISIGGDELKAVGDNLGNGTPGNYIGRMAIYTSKYSLNEIATKSLSIDEIKNDYVSKTKENLVTGKTTLTNGWLVDNALSVINNTNAIHTISNDTSWCGSPNLNVAANTHVSYICIAVNDDLDIGREINNIKIGVVKNNGNIVHEIITREGKATVVKNTMGNIDSSKIIMYPIRKSFSEQVYFIAGFNGMKWGNIPRGSSWQTVAPNGSFPDVDRVLNINNGNYIPQYFLLSDGIPLNNIIPLINTKANLSNDNTFSGTNRFDGSVRLNENVDIRYVTKYEQPLLGNDSIKGSQWAAYFDRNVYIPAGSYVTYLDIRVTDDVSVGSTLSNIYIYEVHRGDRINEDKIVNVSSNSRFGVSNVAGYGKCIRVQLDRTFQRDTYYIVGQKVSNGGKILIANDNKNNIRHAIINEPFVLNQSHSIASKASTTNDKVIHRYTIERVGILQDDIKNINNVLETTVKNTDIGNKPNKIPRIGDNGKLDPSILPAEQNGGVRTVNDRTPDQNGNVTVLAEHIKYTSGNTTTLKDAIDGKPNTVNGQRLNPSNGDIVLTGEHIKYANGQDITIKRAIDNKPNTVNGRGVNLNDGNITIYADNINISSGNSQKISEALGERAHKNQDNIFTKHNRFNDYSPTVHRVFARASFRDNLNTSSITALTDSNAIYFANLSDKYNKPNKPISHLILPIKNARVGDTVSVRCFVFNNINTILQIQDWFRNYTVEDIDMVGCKCIKIPFSYTPNGPIGFGFAIEHHAGGLGAACVQNSNGVHSWTNRHNPQQNQTISPNSHISFPYKICYETTSELVTRFELEEVTQMYPKTLIGEYKNISYDAGNTLDDGMNTWLKANGQTVTNTDYPELFEKLNPNRTINDLDNIQVETFELPNETAAAGYYYICAK